MVTGCRTCLGLGLSGLNRLKLVRSTSSWSDNVFIRIRSGHRMRLVELLGLRLTISVSVLSNRSWRNTFARRFVTANSRTRM